MSDPDYILESTEIFRLELTVSLHGPLYFSQYTGLVPWQSAVYVEVI